MPVVAQGMLTLTDVFDGFSIGLSSDSYVVPTDDLGSSGNFSGCASTVKVMNGKDDVTSSYTISAVASVGITGSLSSNTYTVTAMTTDVGTVDFTATRTGFATLTARFTISKAKKGSEGLTIVVSNENHTFPADASGNVSNYTNSGTTIQVFEGTTALNAATTATSNGSFTIGTPVLSPVSSVTVGARSYSSTTATVAQHSGISAGVDQIAITYPVTIKRRDGSTVTVNKTQTLTKAKQNAAVSRGTVHVYAASTAIVWDDTLANSALAAAPHGGKIVADRVTQYNQSAGWTQTRTWDGTAWSTLTEVLDGSLLVTGSIIGDKLSVNAVRANIIASNGLILTNANYKMSMLTATQPLLLEKDGEKTFSINPDGSGYFKGGLASGTVGLDAISVEARRAINPYYSGYGESVSLAANTFVGSGTAGELAALTTLAINDRVSINVRVAETVVWDGTGSRPLYSNSIYTVTLQKSINAGAWVDVPNGSRSVTVTGYSIAARPYPEPEPASAGYYYDASFNVTDQLTAAGASVKYRLLVTCTTAGTGTASGLKVALMTAEKSAFVKNIYSSNATITRWTDKETGFTILTGQATVNQDASLTVSFGLTLTSVTSAMAMRAFATYNDWAVGAASATTTSVTIYNQFNAGTMNWVVYGYIAP